MLHDSRHFTVVGTTGNTAAISVTSLWKRFTSQRAGDIIALADVHLEVHGGEFVALLGPSGCGKTTLLRILAGLDTQSLGKVLLNGHELTGPSRRTGFMFQSSVLMPWRTVFENIMLPADVAKLRRSDWAEKARSLLKSTGLEDFAGYYPRELSGGMRQRAAICRLLLLDPPILLMDEPFAALDAMTREKMNEDLFNLWRATGKTVVFVTHDVAEAARLSTRVVLMSPRPGRIDRIVDLELPTDSFDRRTNSREYFECLRQLNDVVSVWVRGVK